MNGNGTQCYFCRRVLRNETAEQHSAQCGYVLEPCPNKCGAYIPRNTKSQHLQICRNTRLKSAKSTESLLSISNYDTYPRGSTSSFARSGTLPNNYKPPPSPMPTNAYQYQQYQMPNSLPFHNNQQNLQSYNMAASTQNLALENPKYDQLKDKFQRGHQQHADLIHQIELTMNKLRSDILLVQSQSKTLVEWRTNVQYQLDGIVAEFQTLNKNSKNDINVHRIQEISKDLVNLRNTLNTQQVTLKTVQVDAGQFKNEIEFKLKERENFLRQEIEKFSSANVEQALKLEMLTKENINFKTINEELKVQIEGLQGELKTLKSNHSNMADANKSQAAQLGDLKTAMAKINLNVEVAERSFENIQGLIATQPGRLVWKISDFNIKMENAKSNEKIPIRSPVFYSKDYGYRVRLQVHLNGLKKWRGRHLLACLHVMKGDYDDLLVWPCRIEANIVLKDLENIEKPKDFVRYITAKRNYPDDIADDPQESSTQYIFIPHTTLLKSCHLKNNAVFLEIVINNSQ